MCQFFWGHPVEPTPIGTTNSGSSRIDRFPNVFIYECHDIDVTKYSMLLISDDDVVVHPLFILNIKT